MTSTRVRLKFFKMYVIEVLWNKGNGAIEIERNPKKISNNT